MSATTRNIRSVKSFDEAVDTAPLSSRAMLVSVVTSCYSPSLTDRKVTDEVHQQHNVTAKSGKYKKNCIDVDNPLWQKVCSARDDIRRTYIEMTLPWNQDGTRILTTLMFEKFSQTMRHLTKAYSDASSEFIDAFPTIKAQAKVDLNGMYNERDYPGNIATKFDARVRFAPLPDAEDFRVDLSQEHVLEIRSEIAAEVKKTADEAMKEPYRRLYERICNLVERLTETPKNTRKTAIRDTLVSNVKDLVEILPGLNLTGDERLTDLGEKTKALVANIDSEDLRRFPHVRKQVRKDAKAIQDLMAGFMGPMLATEEE